MVEEKIMKMTNPSRKISPVKWFRQMISTFTWLLVVLVPLSSSAFDIRIGTGETDSFSHFTGRTICRIINKQVKDLHCTVVPSASQVYNLTNLQGGSLDICLVDSRILHDAVARKGNFEFFDISYDNLRGMTTMYDIPISIVVRSNTGVTNLGDLLGKRINAGAPRSPQHFVIDTIMGIKGWKKEDFSLMEELPASLSQDTMAFCHGSIQVMVHIGVHPDPALQQLFKRCQARLVNLGPADIDPLLDSHPAFIRAEIPANTYPAFPERVTTFGTRMKLVTSDSLDEETVYNILDALYRDRKYLKSAHPTLGVLTESKSEISDTGIKLHPGAVTFFTEK